MHELLSKCGVLVVVSQLVQFVDICTHVKQGSSHPPHVPLLMTSGDGQVETQFPRYKNAIAEQLVQLVVVIEQVEQTGAQRSQTLVTVFVMVMLSGHVLAQIPLYI
jgi:hypothetical protein